MKKVILAFLLGLLIYGCAEENTVNRNEIQVTESDRVLENAFQNKISNLQVQGTGIVMKLLPDDTTGSAYQRFILELMTKQTLLISHNIDLAARIDTLQISDNVEFYGEYEWNPEGGVIHWTHYDPGGVHENGWLNHNGITYH